MPEVYVKFNSLEEAMQALQVAHGPANVPGGVLSTAPGTVPGASAYGSPLPAAAPAYVAPAPAPAPAYAPAPAPVAAPVAAPVGGGITQQQIVAQAQLYAKAHGPKAVKAVFGEFGATAASNVDPTNYAALLQRLAV